MSDAGAGRLRPTSIWLLFAIVAAVALGCFLGIEIWLRAGQTPIMVPVVSFAAPLIMAAVVGWQGWKVRSFQRGNRALGALEAGRIFVLAQAGSRAGAVLLGSAIGVGCAYFHTGPTTFLLEQILHLGLAALTSLALLVTSYIAERWCIIRGDEDENGGAAGAVAGAAA